MNKTIYIKDELGKEISDRAEAEGVSFSKALMKHFGACGQKVHSRVETILEFNEKLDRIESKLDELLDHLPKVGNVKIDPAFYEHRPMSVEVPIKVTQTPSLAMPIEIPVPVESDDDMEMLARKRDEIKARKIAMTKGNIRSDSEVIGEVVNQLGQIRRPMPKGGKR